MSNTSLQGTKSRKPLVIGVVVGVVLMVLLAVWVWLPSGAPDAVAQKEELVKPGEAGSEGADSKSKDDDRRVSADTPQTAEVPQGNDSAKPRGATVDSDDQSLGSELDYRARFAVIIGIDAYPGGRSGLERLLFAVNDAREVRDLLRDEFGYAPERTLYLADDAATQQGIRDAFQTWLPKGGIEANDAVLVFFAGHGLVAPQSEEGYLAAVDSINQDFKTCIPVAWVRDQLAKLPCRHRLVCLDSCYSGSLFRSDRVVPNSVTESIRAKGTARGATLVTEMRGTPGTPTIDNLAYYLRKPSFQGISSGRFTPVADGLGAERHSVFTSVLLDVLRDRAGSERDDGVFTFRQLAARVETRVRDALKSQQIPDSGALEPGDGDFLFRPTKPRTTEFIRHKLSAHERLVRLNVQRGLELMDQGDLPASMLWLCEALALDELPLTQANQDGRVAMGQVERQERLARANLQRRRLQAVSELCPPLLQTLIGRGQMRQALFHPSGKTIVTGSIGGEVRMWEVATGNPIGQPIMANGTPLLAWTKNGERLLVGARHPDRPLSRLQVWDVATAQPVSAAIEVPGPLTQIRVDKQQRRFVTVVTQFPALVSEAQIWDAQTMQPIGEVIRRPNKLDVPGAGGLPKEMNGNTLQFATFSPDGLLLVTTWMDGSVVMTNAETGQPTGLEFSHRQDVKHAAFSPDGKSLATAGADFAARVWEVASGKPVGQPLTQSSAVSFVAFSPNGTSLLTASNGDTLIGRINGEARVWNVSTSDPVSAPMRHSGAIIEATFSPDGARVLTTSSDGSARVWALTTGQPLTPPLRHTQPLTHAEFSPDGHRVLTASEDSTVRVWDVSRIGSLPPRITDGVIVAVSPDGRFLFKNHHAKKTLSLVEIESGSTQATWESELTAGLQTAISGDGRRVLISSLNELGSGTLQQWRIVDSGAVAESVPGADLMLPQDVGFSSDGQLAFVAGMFSSGKIVDGQLEIWGEVRVWDVATGKLLPHQPDKLLGIPYGAAAFRNDSQRIATSAMNGQVMVWDLVAGGTPVRAMSGQPGSQRVKYSENGKRLLTVSDAALRVWDADSGQPITSELTHGDNIKIKDANFSRDGERVLSGDEAGTARVWDAQTGKSLARPMRHQGPIQAASFSPDGEFVVTAANDFTARVWDAKTGFPVTPPLRHQLPTVSRAWFSEDGNTVITTDVVRHWTWDVARNQRPVEELKLRSEWLAGLRMDESGDVVDFSWQGANEHFQLLAEARPQNWALRFRQAQFALENDKLADGERFLQFAIKAGANDRDVWQALGEVHSGLKRPTEAVAAFSKALEVGGETVAVRLGRGGAYRQLGQFADAAADFDRLIALVPYAWQPWLQRGFCHATLGQWDKAQSDYDKVIEIGADQPFVFYQAGLVALGHNDAVAFEAKRLVMQKRYSGSLDPEAAWWTAWLWAHEASTPPADVLALAQRAVLQQPLNEAYATALGVLLYRSDRIEEAIERLMQVDQQLQARGKASEVTSPAYYEAFLALSLAKQGKSAEARQWLLRAQASVTREHQQGAADPAALPWTRRLTLKRFLEEAEAVVKP